MENRSYSNLPIEIRQSGDQLRIAGYAAVYNSQSKDLGGFVERIRPGAFDKSLDEIRSGQRDVVCRFNHIGGFNVLARSANKSLELKSDGTGLHYVASLIPTQAAKDLFSMVSSGLISQSSFAFRLSSPTSERWNFAASPVEREILEAELIDVSPVDDPAYPETSVGVRAFQTAEIEYYSNLLKQLKENQNQKQN